jgi:phosphate transport system substrate-binding protein
MTKKLLALVSLLLVLGLAAAACGSDDSGNGSATTDDDRAAPTSDIDDAALEGSITGSGASFPDAFYQAAIDAFAEASPLSVTYNAVGSGQGKKDLSSNLTDFAGSDSLVEDGDGPVPGSFLYVPTVAAPITVAYHLSGVADLRLGPDALAGIFGGTITSWDDPAIEADNPEADLPSKRIVVVHRADGSGTTSNFTRYLAKAAPSVWTLGSGDTVAWPRGSQAGQRNTGVAQLIQDSDGAIGYVDLSDAEATGLTVAKVQNRSGRYVAPTLEGASAALAHADVAEDLSYDPLDAEGDDVYPITSPTYLLVRTAYADRATLDAVKGFVAYLLSEGQDLADDVAFAPLPGELRERALAQLDQLTVG